jgi:hypothetical protein
MKTYQLIMKGGLTRNVEADGYEKQRTDIVFYMDDEVVFRLKANSVIMVDEIRDYAFAASAGSIE